MRPILDEILRARLPLQPRVLLRWQQAIRQEIGPDLDELDALRAPMPEPDAKKGRREAVGA